MSKILKVTISYLVQREVDVIGDDDMTTEEAVESALQEDTKIREPMTPQTRAIRELLSRAKSRTVAAIEDVTPENVRSSIPGETPGVCSHGYDMRI